MSKSNQSKETPCSNDNDQWKTFQMIYNRLQRGFSLYLWITRIHPMLAQHPQFPNEKPAIMCIKNACVETTLMSIRDIDDLFKPRGNRDSDVRASDFFGFKSPGPILSPDERDSINQWIAHLTYHPIRAGTSGYGDDPTMEWDSARLLGKAGQAMIQLIDHVYENHAKHDQAKSEEIHKVRHAFLKALSGLEAVAIDEKYHQSRSA